MTQVVTVLTQRDKKKVQKERVKRGWGSNHITVGDTLIILLMCFAAILFQALVPGRKIQPSGIK